MEATDREYDNSRNSRFSYFYLIDEAPDDEGVFNQCHDPSPIMPHRKLPDLGTIEIRNTKYLVVLSSIGL